MKKDRFSMKNRIGHALIFPFFSDSHLTFALFSPIINDSSNL